MHAHKTIILVVCASQDGVPCNTGSIKVHMHEIFIVCFEIFFCIF
jgi:hypothetical protein